MDQVQQLARAIAQLDPAAKQRLFELLAAQGDLPAPDAAAASEGRQLDTLSPAPEPAPSPDYILVFDGGSRGNPGWGYGSYAITRVLDGARRLERLQLGDGYTNNEAEYDALIAALQDLLRRIEGAGRQPKEFSLEVRGDSALVINQLQGTWKANDPRMVERRDRCRPLLDRFGSVHLKTQPRQESVRVLGH